MRKIHLLMPTLLVASSIPMVSMVGCNRNNPEPGVEKKLVQFNTMGGSFIAAEQVEAGTVIDAPENPTKTDWTFGGWYDDEGCTEGKEHNFNNPVTSDITIYAKWTNGPIPVEYFTVDFMDEESLILSETVKSGDKAIRPQNPSKTDYDFVDWFDNKELSGNPYDFNKSITSDGVILYAKWTEPTPPTAYHTIQFMDEGSSIPSETVKDGDKAVKPQDPTKINYEFGGWYTESALQNLFDWSKEIKQDYTLYPNWLPLGFDYTVSLNADGILDLNSHGGKLGSDYLGVISVNDAYIDRYDVPNSHKYFDVTINNETYEDFSIDTIGAGSNYMVVLTIKESDLERGDHIIITPNVQVEHYLKFTALDEGRAEIRFSASGVSWETFNLQYSYSSLDDPNWNDWDGLPLYLAQGESVYVRNTKSKLSVDSENFIHLYSPDHDKKVKVSGNIMSLLNFQPLYDYCFVELFSGQTQFTSAPFLPATILAPGCYRGMFYGCNGLTTPPEIPATTLAASCCYEMFFSCTALTTAPELPATTLAKDCYNRMFYDCQSIIQTPELPATVLVEGCYYEMFRSCYKLYVRDNQGEETNKIFTCPNAIPSNAVTDMFKGCEGDFRGTPVKNHTYYWYTH